MAMSGAWCRSRVQCDALGAEWKYLRKLMAGAVRGRALRAASEDRARLAELLWQETDVFGYHHRALGTHFPENAEQAFAHMPGKFDRFGRGNEFPRVEVRLRP